MIHILIWSLSGFVCNMFGPGVTVTNTCIEKFLEFHGVRPYGDADVDLRDFAEFQNGYNGIDFRTQ